MKVALSTGGGDAPGLNAVIRAAVLSGLNAGWEMVGVRKGFAGLLGEDDVVRLTTESVRGIGHTGGTILRTTNSGNPCAYPMLQPDGTYQIVDRSDEVVERAKAMGIDALIVIGGDGTLGIGQVLNDKGLHVVGVPKTIDNDVSGTITTFGFDTAVQTALDALDKLHTTAESHDRVIVLEVMGRHSGFIALHSGVAGSADVVLIPEIPYDVDKVCDKITTRSRAGRNFSIVVVAEGAAPLGGTHSILGASLPGQAVRVGGISDQLARDIQTRTGQETRSLVLGHLQRGGQPTGYDRFLATRFGGAAIRAVAEGKWGHMMALQSPNIVAIPIQEALREVKRVDPRHDSVLTAKAMGIVFGD